MARINSMLALRIFILVAALNFIQCVDLYFFIRIMEFYWHNFLNNGI